MARTSPTALPQLVLLALLLVTGMAGSLMAQPVAQRIAAVVNDDVITSQDLLDRLDLAAVSSGLPNDPQTKQRLAPQVLRGFIDEKLQLQEARRLGLDVTEAEIDQALDTIAARNNTDRQTLLRFLTSRGINPRTLREQLRAQIAWLKIIAREVRPRIVVSQEQVEFAVKRAAGRPGGDEVLLSEILLPVYERGQENAVLAQARELVATLRAGADFGALARQVSTAASAENGGDLGWVRTEGLAPELRDQIASLQPGQISPPIPGPNGVHILQLRDRRAGAAAAVDREQVRQSIERQQLERQASRYLQDLRREAFVDVRL